MSNCKFVTVELELSSFGCGVCDHLAFLYPEINLWEIKKKSIKETGYFSIPRFIYELDAIYSKAKVNSIQPDQWVLFYLGLIKVTRKLKSLALSVFDKLKLFLSNSFLLNFLLDSLTYKPTKAARLNPFIYFP